MLTRFPELLAAYLRRKDGMSAQALGDQTGVSQSTMSRIALGQRAPDLDKLDSWADVLDLNGGERDGFLLAGQLAHCPQPVIELIERQDAEHAALLRRIEAMEQAIRILKGGGPPPKPRSRPRAR